MVVVAGRVVVAAAVVEVDVDGALVVTGVVDAATLVAAAAADVAGAELSLPLHPPTTSAATPKASKRR